MNCKTLFCAVAFALLAAAAECADPAPLAPTAAQAEAFLSANAESKSVPRRIGLSEMHRIAGENNAMDRALAEAVRQTADAAAREQVLELYCWRRLPVPPVKIEHFRESVRDLEQAANKNPWLSVFKLYKAALDQNRPALLHAAENLSVPQAFPVVAAEKAHFDLLLELGQSRVQAGLTVVSHRDYNALNALRDLDRILTREAAFLADAGAAADARKLAGARDALRAAYLSCAHTLIERLFSLSLSKQNTERDALLAKADAIPWLTDVARLAGPLSDMGETRAWKLVVEPLISNELALVDAPPTLASSRSAELTVHAERKTSSTSGADYSGSVRATLEQLTINCDALTVRSTAGNAATMLLGAGHVSISGMAGYASITADRFTFSSDASAFALGGDVRLSAPSSTLKATYVLLSTAGEVREKKTLLQDFAAAGDLPAKLALLPEIARIYEDAELSADVRYLLALDLARKHMTWHPPPPAPKEKRQREHQRHRIYDERWLDAHTGEPWMISVTPSGELAPLRAEGDRADNKVTQLYWRLTEPAHADILHALKLLDSIVDSKDKELSKRARRWADELRRNNTVVTFDLPGGYVPGEDGPLVMDVRNAETVSLKLYRVRSVPAMLSAAARIGTDFIYCDHGLREEEHVKHLQEMIKYIEQSERIDAAPWRKKAIDPPALDEKDLVEKWYVAVADLPDIGSRGAERAERLDDPWDGQDDEAAYFDDMCQHYRDRLDKHYRGSASWQCDKVAWIPKRALKEGGGYVLLAEANGQKAYAPILVAPLSLTLRRCRDGVFALVSDGDAAKTLAGAGIYAPGSSSREITDTQGAAFMHVFASGDCPIVAEKDGRFAIAGFGKVFEGLYVTQWDREIHGRHFFRGTLRERLKSASSDALVFADRMVVAAYTDRPTYRPGQTVQFKLILRTLAPREDRAVKPPDSSAFRAADFDLETQLQLLPEDTPISYDVISPRGRIVSSGSLKLNDYGTAAGSIALSTEDSVGAYALRIRTGSSDRIVPHVFDVKYYRRPNFQLTVDGVPPVLSPGGALTLSMHGEYYFGKPVSGGAVEARLVRFDQAGPLASAAATLDAAGKSAVTLEMPRALPGGKYAVVSTLRDDSGRTVSASVACEVPMPVAHADAKGLAALPRFVKAGSPLSVQSSAAEVLAERSGTEKVSRRVRVTDNVAALILTEPGWYQLTAGAEHANIFVYGGHARPHETPSLDISEIKENDARINPREPRWVDLTRYSGPYYDEVSDERWDDAWDRKQNRLLALFDKYHAHVGGSLAVLIYAPNAGKILFTIEGETVADYVLADIPKGESYQVIEIPIKERYLPNFYLQGRIAGRGQARVEEELELLRKERLAKNIESGNSEDPQWCRIDVVDPARKSGGEKLKVAVQTDKPQYKPGETVAVTMHVTDLAGKPSAAELSLAAVDESVFSFGEDYLGSLAALFTSAHPPRSYYRKTWRSYDAQRWFSPELAMEQLQAMRKLTEMAMALDSLEQAIKGVHETLVPPMLRETPPPLAFFGQMPIGRIPAARLRTDFRETAAWQPQLRAGPDGVVKTSFTLPDSLTAYRLSAVGLTRAAELGTARAEIKVALPLSVQVFVPRFAVETDRLELAALIHNHTSEPRECQAAWQIEGLDIQQPESSRAQWTLSVENGKSRLSGRVTVAAGQSLRVPLMVVATASGAAKVSFQIEGVDAEQRELQILTVGRAREIALTGAFNDTHQLTLPEGFVADDIRISMARASAAQAMDGLAYLVEYPYGCVEQTMSRFFPAVVVKQALQDSPIALPPEVAAKLPGAIAQGLARLYNFQHEDGGWGWWEKDVTNHNLTVYVAYGLARCKLTGTHVDQAVLDRACAYLKNELSAGRLAQRETHTAHGALALEGRELEARAWLVLALAGAAPIETLTGHVQSRPVAGMSFIERSNLALACKYAGLSELAERLAAAPADAPKSAEELALRLNVQLACGAALKECNLTTASLLAKRTGLHWESTQATSYAIEALAQMLRYARAGEAPKSARIAVNGVALIDLKEPEQLKEVVYRATAKGAQLPRGGGARIELAVAGAESVSYAITAKGTQRLDKMEPIGEDVKLTRRYSTLAGEPVAGAIKVGDVIAVHLTLDLTAAQNYVLVEERRPAGCEFADERIVGIDAAAAAHVEFRDDRLCVFHAGLSAGRHEFTYYLRAETPGVSHVLPGCAYPMYDERKRGETGASTIEIR